MKSWNLVLVTLAMVSCLGCTPPEVKAGRYARQGNWVQSAKSFEEAGQRDQGLGGPVKSARAVHFYRMAAYNYAFRSSMPDHAEACFARALECASSTGGQFPTQDITSVLADRFMFQAKQSVKQAVDQFLQWVEKNPQHSSTACRAATWLMEQPDAQKHPVGLERVHEFLFLKNAGYPNAFRYATALKALGRNDEAIRVLEYGNRTDANPKEESDISLLRPPNLELLADLLKIKGLAGKAQQTTEEATLSRELWAVCIKEENEVWKGSPLAHGKGLEAVADLLQSKGRTSEALKFIDKADIALIRALNQERGRANKAAQSAKAAREEATDAAERAERRKSEEEAMAAYLSVLKNMQPH